jgi:hypothetical protein
MQLGVRNFVLLGAVRTSSVSSEADQLDVVFQFHGPQFVGQVEGCDGLNLCLAVHIFWMGGQLIVIVITEKTLKGFP